MATHMSKPLLKPLRVCVRARAHAHVRTRTCVCVCVCVCVCACVRVHQTWYQTTAVGKLQVATNESLVFVESPPSAFALWWCLLTTV